MYNETAKRMSGCKRSKLAGAQAFQLGLEIGDAEEGRSQFAGLVSNFVFQPAHALPGVRDVAELLAQRVDLAGPASLVRLLAVLSEVGAFQGCRKLGLQVGDIARG